MPLRKKKPTPKPQSSAPTPPAIAQRLAHGVTYGVFQTAENTWHYVFGDAEEPSVPQATRALAELAAEAAIKMLRRR